MVEAMSSHRPYRPALGLEQALAEIETGRAILYDADVTDVCGGLFRGRVLVQLISSCVCGGSVPTPSRCPIRRAFCMPQSS